jgi:putative acetyltransferase
MSLVLERVESPTDDARRLIEELEEELSGDYSAEQRHGLSVERVFQPNISFFVARLNGEAVGCGGIAFEDGWAELKRMYVRVPYRGRRIGRSILDRLMDEARARGVGRLVLETGDVLHSPHRLYEGAGFTRCTAFGPYAAMPPHKTARCIFFEKHIG